METSVTKTRGTILGKSIGFLLGLSVLFVFLLLGVGAYFFSEYVTDWRIQRATQATSIEIVGHGLSSHEVESLGKRIDEFLNQNNLAENSNPLRLSANELTALVTEPLPRDVSSRIRFEFEDGGLFLRGSIDLAEWGYEGRYLNGRLWVSIDKIGGRYRFSLADLKGNQGVWISAKSLRAIGLQNLTGYAYRHPQLSPILQKTDRIELQDQVLVLFPKTLALED